MKQLLLLFALATPAAAQTEVPASTEAPETERATVVAPIPADAPLVAPPLESRDLTVELVGNGTALVRDARRIELQKGPNRLRLVGVAEKRTTLGLSISPRVRILRDLGQRYPASEGKWQPSFDLSQFVGQKITILRPVGNEEKPITGTLLETSPILLDTSEGILVNPAGQVILPTGSRTARTVSKDLSGWQPEWIVDAPQSGNYLSEFRYQVAGMNYTTLYTATLVGDRVQLEGVVNLQNSTDPDIALALRGASLWVAGGLLRFAAPIDFFTATDSLGFASGEAPLQARFSFRRSTPFEQSFQNALAARSVFIQNTPQNGLGVFLPPGKLVLNRTIEQNGAPTTSLVSQTDNWGGFAPGGQIDLPLGPSDSVKVSRTVSSRLLNPVTREWTVEFAIQSDQTLALIEPIPENARLGEASPKPRTREKNSLSWILPPSNDPISVKYVVETPA